MGDECFVSVDKSLTNVTTTAGLSDYESCVRDTPVECIAVCASRDANTVGTFPNKLNALIAQKQAGRRLRVNLGLEEEGEDAVEAENDVNNKVNDEVDANG